MSIRFWNAFAKITAWPLQWLCFRTKIYYEDKSVQRRSIKGAAIIISNHTAVFDYAVYLFVFYTRTLRVQMAELLFDKKPLGWLLKRLGGIRVDRTTRDMGFVAKSNEILRNGGVVGIFPEGRFPKKGEIRPLPFATSAAFIALDSGVPVIPVYTNGSYFKLKRARVIIGKPVYVRELYDADATEKENLSRITEKLREKVIYLGTLLNGYEKKD